MRANLKRLNLSQAIRPSPSGLPYFSISTKTLSFLSGFYPVCQSSSNLDSFNFFIFPFKIFSSFPDLSLAAGLPGAALLCELVDPDDPDGGIASRDACLKFAKQHGLKVTTIEMLKKWREETEGELSLDIESVGRKGKGQGKGEKNVNIEDLDRTRGVDINSQKVVGPVVNGNGI